MMAKSTFELVEEALRKEVRKIDKRVRVAAVEQSKKKDAVRQYLDIGGKGGDLKRALGKAVSHLSISYRR